MVTKVIEIRHAVLRTALENPNKNYVLVCGNHNARCHEFALMADEITQKLSDFPIMINKTNMMFVMPEGGHLRLLSFKYRQDVERLQGMRYAQYFTDESCDTWTPDFSDYCQIMLKAHQRQ